MGRHSRGIGHRRPRLHRPARLDGRSRRQAGRPHERRRRGARRRLGRPVHPFDGLTSQRARRTAWPGRNWRRPHALRTGLVWSGLRRLRRGDLRRPRRFDRARRRLDGGGLRHVEGLGLDRAAAGGLLPPGRLHGRGLPGGRGLHAGGKFRGGGRLSGWAQGLAVGSRRRRFHARRGLWRLERLAIGFNRLLHGEQEAVPAGRRSAGQEPGA